ncbi:MAG: DMT family transporter [Rhodobacteraceae bacterium]|nr:DMT family transporter [Paracoccaceae bacterium]
MFGPGRRVPFLALIVFGAGWGLTQPLSKIVVTAGFAPLGIIFWQLIIGTGLLVVISLVRRTWPPLHADALKLYVFIALLGNVLPDIASYNAYEVLPAGVMSIIMSAVPLLAFPVALTLKIERFSWQRLAGLALGMVGVAMIALPQAKLPVGVSLGWVLIAMIAPLCYAFEGNGVDLLSRKKTQAEPTALDALLGASVIGAAIALPMALISGQMFSLVGPWGVPHYTILAIAVIHTLVYSGYVWLVRQSGAVFAAQVSYLVTGFGVAWAMLILGERYSLLVWAAMGLMFAGLMLVLPRAQKES